MVGLIVLLWAWRERRATRASGWLLALAVSNCLLILSQAAASMAPPVIKDAVWPVTWLGVAFIGPTYLLAVARYIGYPIRHRWGVQIAIWVGPVALALLAGTNGFHQLLWDTDLTNRFPAGTLVTLQVPPLARAGQALAGLYGFVGLGLAMRAHRTAPRAYRDGVRMIATSLVIALGFGLPAAASPAAPAVTGALANMGMVASTAIMLVCVRRYPVAVHRFGFMEAAREVWMDLLREGIVVIDSSGVVADHNPAAQRLLGLPGQVIGAHAHEGLPPWLGALADDRSAPQETSREMADGTTLDITVNRVATHPGEPTDTVLVLRDATARARAEERLEQMAHLDSLTGLANRARFDAELAQAVAAGARASLLLLDINGFKTVNDTHGHASGDDLLREVAQRLSACVGDAFVARLGGDEFVVLRPYHDQDAAVAAAHEVAATFDRDLSAGGHVLRVSASVGVALVDVHGADVLRCADVAMYQAKNAGQRVRLYDPADDPNTPERLQHLSDLRGAIARGEMVLHYQPVFDLERDRAAGAEALVRWAHPRKGLLAPAAFLADLEGLGAGRELARWVAARCLADRASWPVGEGFQVAFNLSARDLADPVLAADLVEMVHVSGLSGSEVIVEVTEAAFLTSAGDSQEHRSLELLRSAGIRLVLDDFGTGHASVTTLRDLRGSVAKLGGVFVAAMRQSPDDLALVRGLTDLARHLEYQVLAEWVEDEETLDIVRGLGIRFVQGFHLARPMPHAYMVRWLAGLPSETGASPRPVRLP